MKPIFGRMGQMLSWFASPVFEGDEEKTHQAGLVNIIGWSSIAFTSAVMVANVVDGTTPFVTQALDLVACIVIVQFLLWLRRGRVTLASLGLVFSGLVYLTAVTASLGTVYASSTPIFAFWVLVTGVLFGLRGVVLGTVGASLAVLGLMVAENAHWLVTPADGVSLADWVTYTALFAFTGGLSYYVDQRTKRALVCAQTEVAQRKQAQSELRQARDIAWAAQQALQSANEELSRLSVTDSLTGVYNRRHFVKMADTERAQVLRYQTTLSMLIFDVDHFKSINDGYGHPTGDRVLIEITQLVSASLRHGDLLARWGGEEFVVIMPQCGTPEALQLAEKLRVLIAAHPFSEVHTVTVSLGVAEFKPDELLDAWFKRVDLALYAAKSSGRNMVRLAT